MNVEIIELEKKHLLEYDVENFLFKMVKESYNLDYVPEYHYDIKNLCKYYINPFKNNFFIAINTRNDELIGTSGIRNYDKDYKIKNRNYCPENTASIYRLFVEKEFRHQKIATNMLSEIEKFCKTRGYHEIYLHTQKNSYGALPFWLHQNYNIVYNTHNKLGTIHMEKIL